MRPGVGWGVVLGHGAQREEPALGSRACCVHSNCVHSFLTGYYFIYLGLSVFICQMEWKQTNKQNKPVLSVS